MTLPWRDINAYALQNIDYIANASPFRAFVSRCSQQLQFSIALLVAAVFSLHLSEPHAVHAVSATVLPTFDIEF